MDRSRIYTAVNAEDVKPGMTGFFSDSINGLKGNFKRGDIKELVDVLSEDKVERFVSDGDMTWALFMPFEAEDQARIVDDIARLLLLGRYAKDIIAERLPLSVLMPLYRALTGDGHGD